MGPDRLQLFDKRLCNEILSLNVATLPDFVERHRHRLGEFSLFRCDFDGVAADRRVQRLIESGETEGSLREALVDTLCFYGRAIPLDYWGCYVEVFAARDPLDSIADSSLFPERQQPTFVLLRPNHVDTILDSLTRHRNDLSIMSDDDFRLLRQWRILCDGDPAQMVAYVFDA